MPLTVVCLVSILALIGRPTSFDDISTKVAAFEKTFRGEPRQPPPSPEQRTAAVATLDGLDHVSVAKALVTAYGLCEEELAPSEEERQKINTQIEELTKGQELDPRWLPEETRKSLDEFKARARTLATRIDAIHALEARILDVVQKMKSDASVGWLVGNVVGAKGLPLSLKLFLARSAGRRGEVMAAPLTKALAKAKEGEELTVVLEALGHCGAAAREAAPTVAAQLVSKDATLREKAAWVLSQLGAAQGIGPLVKAIEVEEETHTRRRMGIALEVLTRKDFGENAKAWKSWWDDDQAKMLAGELPVGGGTSKLAKAMMDASSPRNGGGDRRYAATYYGIPVEGKSIVYVIDCSGSMVVSAKDPKYEEDRKPVDAGADSRMEATKAALIEVLGKLSTQDRFNIICFNDLAHAYSPKMLPATPDEVKQARDYVADLQASNSTNIHDALQEAFRLAGLGSHDKYYKSNIDTIFLLTDGAPTTNEGVLDSTDRVLEAARRWNPVQHVVIHTIGIGKDISTTFLKRLARENGGRFVQQ